MDKFYVFVFFGFYLEYNGFCRVGFYFGYIFLWFFDWRNVSCRRRIFNVI